MRSLEPLVEVSRRGRVRARVNLAAMIVCAGEVHMTRSLEPLVQGSRRVWGRVNVKARIVCADAEP